ncbi:MAG: hypothetical protein KDA68_03720 [Planctomycetaceae bacterium]|nr:hypothetical protein [Planctomycetaceae bacterium]
MLIWKLLLAGSLLVDSGFCRELLVNFGMEAEPDFILTDHAQPQLEVLVLPDQAIPMNAKQWIDFDFEGEGDAVFKSVYISSGIVFIESDEVAAGIPLETNRLVLTGQAVTDKSMEFVAKLENLEYLELADNRITDAGMRKIQGIQTLTTLDLTGTQVTDKIAEVVNQFHNLKSLVLSRTSVTNACLQQLNGSQKLESLRLCETGIDDDGIAHLAKFPNLTELSLRELNLTDRSLTSLSQLHELRVLELSGTKVGQNLSGIENLINLQLLELNRTKINPKELRHLQNAPRLFSLGLINSPVGDDAIPYLEKMRFPLGLYLKGSGISPAGIKSLRKALPFYEIDDKFDDAAECAIFERGGWTELDDGTSISAARLTSAEIKMYVVEELPDEAKVKILPDADLVEPVTP